MLTIALLAMTAAASASEGPARSSRLLGDAPLLATGALLAQAPPADAPAPQALPSLENLRSQKRELERARPNVGGEVAKLIIGIVGIVLGAGAMFTGGVLVLVGALLGQYTGSVFIAGIVVLAVGVAALVVGIVLAVSGGRALGPARAERNALDEKIRAIDAQIEQLEAAPPPPPPSSVERQRGPTPSLVVLAF